MDMIAQHETPVGLFQPLRRGLVRDVPIIGRIVIAKLKRRRLRVEPDQPALLALNDVKELIRCPVKPVRRPKQFDVSSRATSRTSRTLYSLLERGLVRCGFQAEFSESSLSEIRCWSNSWRIWRGVSRRFERNAFLLRHILGIMGNADKVPRSSAVAAVSFPVKPW